MRAAMRFILNRMARRSLVAFRLLQDLYQPHLALDQGLAAVGEVHEHGVELAAKACLVAP